MSVVASILRYARLLLVVSWLWLALAAVPAAAQPARHLDASIHAQSEEPTPGTTTRLAIRMVPEAGWHGYWTNPGDSGLSVEANWTLPTGVRIGQLEHPAPTLLRLAGLASYVHKGAFTLLADLTIDKSVAPGTVLPIRAQLSWLVCSDTLCVPESATFDLRLVTGGGKAKADSRSIIRAAEASLPRRDAAAASMTGGGGRWTFAIAGAGNLDAERTRLFPADSGWFDAGAAQSVTRDADGALAVTVAASGAPPTERFTGVISDGTRSYAIRTGDAPATAGPAPAPSESAANSNSLPFANGAPVSLPAASSAPDMPGSSTTAPTTLRIALMGAILGGLLLNLMPCVFPILSLKALSLAKSGADPRSARIEGTSYFAGSVITTTALGGILIAARALGHDIGWSFQLQDPRIILLLMLLSLAIALNLAGLFELRGPSLAGGWMDRRGGVGAFGTGALAALIATPCSGPFLGVALGAALVLPPLAALTVFAGLGLGMALPFLLIAWVPRLQRWLPKPGTWMVTFRRILAVPMLATALGLAWVLGRQSGVDGLTIGLAIAALAGLGLWWAGLRQMRGVSVSHAFVPLALAVILTASVDFPQASAASVATAKGRQPFSEARLAQLRAAGTPVFVDFTADWCLICQVNDRIAIDRPQTRAAFEKAGVVVMEGDWTRGDPAITRFLAKQGRNSIPYYLFATKSGELRELPQVLSSDMLVELAGPPG